MSIRRRTMIGIAAAIWLPTALAPPVSAQASPTHASHTSLEPVAMAHARGTFEVQLTPHAPEAGADGTVPARLTLDKQFHGDLEATSHGQMLAASTGVEGSAGYVAMERVHGTLQGRSGSFVLQHSGTMDRGSQKLSITVVPDSGTEELAGLAGRMDIIIANGTHSYEFEYTIPEAR